jgi:pimeloyl-ACP methyl ester carboxylesterase
MRVEELYFYNAGSRLAATLKLPDDDLPGSVPGIVQGPGWLGLRDARLYTPYHDALTAAGFAVLVIDYRGHGGSDGDSSTLDPREQVSDIRAGLTYLETRSEIDPRRLGLFGSGGTGGGNAVYAAGLDARVQATVAQVPISDGREWLRRMRREHEWQAFLQDLGDARRQYVLTGERVMVGPRTEIAVPMPERVTTDVKRDVREREAQSVALLSADAIIDYRPADVVARISPRALMLIAVEHDVVTPEEHAMELYRLAGPPKRIVIQTGTTHYAAYGEYADLVIPLIVEWYVTHLQPRAIAVRDGLSDESEIYLDRSSAAGSHARG